jgi:hypothetical protein
MTHLQRNKLLKSSQHGFMPGRSCTTNLLTFLEKATAAIDSGQSFDAVFLDFAKAFDKVPRARLLKKGQGPWHLRTVIALDTKLVDRTAAAGSTERRNV